MPQSTFRPWTLQEDRLLVQHSDWTLSCLAAALDRSVNAVRHRRSRMGSIGQRRWSSDEVAELCRLYSVPADAYVDLAAFCARFGRGRSAVQEKARELGLSGSRHRRKVAVRKDAPRFGDEAERKAHVAHVRKEWHRSNPHPRGAAGLRHSAETRAKISAAVRAANDRCASEGRSRYSDEERQRRSDLMTERKQTDPRMREGFSRSAGGRREDLGDTYFRSSWEANIARYLNFLMAHGQIARWEYEPDTFWFEAIKRGVRSYKPDFKIWDTLDSEPYYWEVKGWDYARGQTALKRMAKYYPRVTLHLIDEDTYKAIAKSKALIPGWETQRRRLPPEVE